MINGVRSKEEWIEVGLLESKRILSKEGSVDDEKKAA